MAKGGLAKDLCECIVAIHIPLITSYLYKYIELKGEGD